MISLIVGVICVVLALVILGKAQRSSDAVLARVCGYIALLAGAILVVSGVVGA